MIVFDNQENDKVNVSATSETEEKALLKAKELMTLTDEDKVQAHAFAVKHKCDACVLVSKDPEWNKDVCDVSEVERVPLSDGESVLYIISYADALKQ